MFKDTLWAYYDTHKRSHLPWRFPDTNDLFDPYKIMVSEIMLQQTQAERVIPKYQQFLQMFPDSQTLASAPLSDVLQAWQGLGYNRRAKFLWEAAKEVTQKNSFPRTMEELTSLPGVGVNTAGAIMAYAYNRPTVFIETNVRTVYIYHFFEGAEKVSDKDLAELVHATIDDDNPREFYWALMDYGTYLKKQHGNIARLSSTYKKQSAFHGSKRQIRGAVIRSLTEKPHTLDELRVAIFDDRLEEVIKDLTNENLIQRTTDTYHL